MLQLAPQRMRLSRLQRSLPGISTGVLERYVQQMVALGLLSRSRFKEMPPRVELELTDAGRELLPIAGSLARWGMRHMWWSPDGRTAVGLETLLQMLPVLLEEERDLPDGDVQAILTHEQRPPAVTTYRVENGSLRLLDASASGVARAQIEGGRNAWTAALGPAADYNQLRFSGDRELGTGILDPLPGRRG